MWPEKQPTSNIVVIKLPAHPTHHNSSQRELKIKTHPTLSVLEKALQTIEASNIGDLLHRTYALITQTEQLLLLEGFYEDVPIPSPFILAMILYNSIIASQYNDLPIFRETTPIFPITIPDNYKKLLDRSLKQAYDTSTPDRRLVFNTPIQTANISEWRTWNTLANFLNTYLIPYGFQIKFSTETTTYCDESDRRKRDCETYVSSASVQLTFTPPSMPQQGRA